MRDRMLIAKRGLIQRVEEPRWKLNGWLSGEVGTRGGFCCKWDQPKACGKLIFVVVEMASAPSSGERGIGEWGEVGERSDGKW